MLPKLSPSARPKRFDAIDSSLSLQQDTKNIDEDIIGAFHQMTAELKTQHADHLTDLKMHCVEQMAEFKAERAKEMTGFDMHCNR
jgi:hypothetical protein